MLQDTPKKKRRLGKKILLFINYIFIVILLTSYLAPYINSKRCTLLQFIGLSYPFLIYINLFFVLFWLFRRKIYFIISLIAILIGWNVLGTYYQYNKTQEITPADKNLIKVISYNVKNFDLYNYSNKWKLNFENRNKIFNIIDKESPQIICYQEFVTDSSGNFLTLDTLKKFQRANNVHTVYTGSSRNINFFGIATFSAYPIVNKGCIEFKNSDHNICIYSDIKINDDTIRVYNVHFQSIHLSNSERQFANDWSKIKNLNKKQSISNNSKRILGRLKLAYIRRAEQVDIVSEHIEKCPYSIIVCGDFNDTPNSYVYHKMTKKLEDAFVQSGKGFGKTYNGIFPAFRIDYILFSNNFKAINCQVIPVDYSDHQPIKTYLKLKN